MPVEPNIFYFVCSRVGRYNEYELDGGGVVGKMKLCTLGWRIPMYTASFCPDFLRTFLF